MSWKSFFSSACFLCSAKTFSLSLLESAILCSCLASSNCVNKCQEGGERGGAAWAKTHCLEGCCCGIKTVSPYLCHLPSMLCVVAHALEVSKLFTSQLNGSLKVSYLVVKVESFLESNGSANDMPECIRISISKPPRVSAVLPCTFCVYVLLRCIL